MTFRRIILAGLAATGLMLTRPAVAQTQSIFAAASLTEALTDIAAAWQRAGHPAPRLVFASSSTLARQIEQGAPATLFASADERWMDELDTKGLLAPGTRSDLVGNRLVLIVPKDRARTVAIGPGLDLAALLGDRGRLAVGDTAHVPAGIYARQALTALGVWAQAEPRLAAAEDVRSALRLVELGEAPAGIVYATDAAASGKVAVAAVFPPGLHEPITYPVAVVKAGDTKEARDLLAYLTGPDARAIFTKRGFTPPE